MRMLRCVRGWMAAAVLVGAGACASAGHADGGELPDPCAAQRPPPAGWTWVERFGAHLPLPPGYVFETNVVAHGGTVWAGAGGARFQVARGLWGPPTFRGELPERRVCTTRIGGRNVLMVLIRDERGYFLSVWGGRYDEDEYGYTTMFSWHGTSPRELRTFLIVLHALRFDLPRP